MRKFTALLLLLCVLLTGCQIELLLPTEAPFVADGNLNVHFIDVGQADSILLECDGVFALVDGGNTADGDLVIDYLESQNVRKLSLVVGTHPHEDHIGGLAAVLDHFPAENLWFSAQPNTNKTITKFLDAAERQDLDIVEGKPGMQFALGRATITVLGPVRTDYDDANNLSLVLMVQFGSTRFLLTGDMERTAENDLIESGADLRADVLKVGHHGSSSSTGYRFLREVMPTYGIISCGQDNEYGHPHEESLSRLEDAEVVVFRTDLVSHIVAVSDGKNITITYAVEETALPNAA